MSIDAGSVYSSVRIRLDQLDGDLKGVYARLNQLETHTKESSKSTAKAFDVMNVAAVASMVGIGVAIKSAVTQFAGFEQSMANVASVAGGSAEDFQRMTDAAKTAGATTRFTASQAADAMYYLASAGLDASQSIAALDGVLNLAGATQSDLASTSATLTATLSQFGLAAADSTKVSNVFAAAIGNSQATMSKLADSMRYVGAVAGAFKISLEETTGALQILYNAGYQGEQAGTILRNVLSDLANESSPAIAKLAQLGIAFKDVNPAVHDLGSIIETLREKNLTAAQALAVFGDRAGPGMVSLLNAGQGAIEEYTKAVTGTNAATEMYAKQNDTLAGSFDEMTSAAESAGISLGKVFGPILRDLLGVLKNMLLAISEAPPVFQALAGAVGVAIAAISAAIPVLKLFGVAIGTAAGPLGWIALGLTAVTTAAALSSGKIKENTARIASMGEAAGVTAEQAKKLEAAFNRSDIKTANIKSVENDVKRLAKELGVSERAAIDVALASKKISPHYKDLLVQLRPISVELEAQQELVRGMSAAEDLLLEKTLRRKAAESAAAAEKARAAALEAEELSRAARIKKLAEDRTAIVKEYESAIAGVTSLESAGYLSAEEANKRRISANDKLINGLQALGYLSAEDGEIGWSILQSAVARVTALQAATVEMEKQKKVVEAQKDAESDLARIRAEGAASLVDLTISYNAALAEGEKTREKEIDEWYEKQKAIIAASGATDEYKEKALRALEDVYAKMKDDAAAKKLKANLLLALDTALTMLKALSDALTAFADKEVEETKRAELEKLAIREEAAKTAYDQRVAALDAELQAELYAKGLASAATLEQYEEQLRIAKETGDAELIDKAEKALEKFKIEEKYRKKKEDAEKAQVELEKQLAKERAAIEYKAALNSWRINLAAATAGAAIAVINGLKTEPFVPAGIAAGVSAGALGAAQVAQVAVQRPVQGFATGGIVSGSSFSGDKIGAALNSGEMVLTRAQQAELFKLANGASGSAMSLSIPVSFSADGFRDFLVGVIDFTIANGEVAIDARKLTNLDAAVRGAR